MTLHQITTVFIIFRGLFYQKKIPKGQNLFCVYIKERGEWGTGRHPNQNQNWVNTSCWTKYFLYWCWNFFRDKTPWYRFPWRRNWPDAIIIILLSIFMPIIKIISFYQNHVCWKVEALMMHSMFNVHRRRGVCKMKLLKSRYFSQ